MSESIDVGLLLEGTFPFVKGGVSSWVHDLIRAFPEIRFGIAFIGSHPDDYGGPKYALPRNVVHFETHFLREPEAAPPVKARRAGDGFRREAEQLHRGLRGGCPVDANLGRLLSGSPLTEEAFLRSPEAWQYIADRYQAESREPSFINYFWSVRGMHAPLFRLMRIAQKFPQASAYHAVSTGYAGFLGALLHHRDGRPLVLTEHGIYTRERHIELLQCDWVPDSRAILERQTPRVAYLREAWIRFYNGLGRACYDAADPIVTLYEGNRERQVTDGADSRRTQVIPNGVDLARFQPLAAARTLEIPRVATLIGRVVPIKDVLGFIRAMRIVVDRMPEAQGWIVGPEDEDPGYARECRSLVQILGLGGRVHFLGFRDVADILPKTGVVVLSSISEAQPLVLLEGFAAGVPAVATDVGACREMIEGADDQDRAYGRAGRVVGISDPAALARGIHGLLSDKTAWAAASRAGFRRVTARYGRERMVESYRAIYREAIARAGGSGAAALKAAPKPGL